MGTNIVNPTRVGGGPSRPHFFSNLCHGLKNSAIELKLGDFFQNFLGSLKIIILAAKKMDQRVKLGHSETGVWKFF